MNEVLRTNGLVIGYEGKALFPAMDVALKQGDHVALIGANGSGKTTLFKTLTGHLKPLQGSVTLCGKPLEDHSANERAKLFSLVLTEKPDDHSGLMARIPKQDEEMIQEKLQLTGVLHLIDRDFVSLSDGEKQKVMIAKALVQDTPIIYMDEPTAFLDYPSKVELMRLIRKIAEEEHKTILYSSHDLELILKHCPLLWVVAKGKPLTVGSPKELLEQHIIEHYLSIDNLPL